MKIVLLVLIAIISYFLGSLNGPVLVSRYVLKQDVRRTGTWNPLYSAFMDTYGAKGLAMLAGFDIIKSIIAVLLGGLLLSAVGETAMGRLFAAFCLLLGHAFPFLYLFKGGKGLLCAGTMLFFIDWRVALCCWAAFALVLIFTKYFALAGSVAAILAPIFMWIFKSSALEGAIALFCALIIVIKYSENIVRILGGTEPQLAAKRGSASGPADDEY